MAHAVLLLGSTGPGGAVCLQLGRWAGQRAWEWGVCSDLLPIFLIGLLALLLLSFRSSFYILDTSPLSDIKFTNSFS